MQVTRLALATSTFIVEPVRDASELDALFAEINASTARSLDINHLFAHLEPTLLKLAALVGTPHPTVESLHITSSTPLLSDVEQAAFSCFLKSFSAPTCCITHLGLNAQWLTAACVSDLCTMLCVNTSLRSFALSAWHQPVPVLFGLAAMLRENRTLTSLRLNTSSSAVTAMLQDRGAAEWTLQEFLNSIAYGNITVQRFSLGYGEQFFASVLGRNRTLAAACSQKIAFENEEEDDYAQQVCSLPEEMWMWILRSLNLNVLREARAVCKCWRRVVDDEIRRRPASAFSSFYEQHIRKRQATQTLASFFGTPLVYL